MNGRKTILAGIAAGALVTVAVAGPAAARDLTVVSWGGAYQDAQREVYFKPFVETTKIKLLEESWDGGVGVLRAKIQGGNNNWDVVQVESEELVLGCEEGLYEKIDWEKVGGKDKLMDDAVHECGVGTIVYNFILSYDADRIKDGPKSWADFWNVQKWPGKRALRKGPKTNLEIALMADGVPPAEVYKVLATDAGVERAFRKLDELKPHLIWWEKGSQPPQLLAAGEVAMTSAYNGRIAAANQADKKNFRIVWQNSLYTVDYWVIMKGTPNKAQAEQFINFASQPENQAKLPAKIPYGVTAKAATAKIDPKILPELPTAPENIATALYINEPFWVENLDRLNQRFNAWVAR
ncbi:MAG TPA: ABC transporter substrate-binding protein [Alphaproteobacteria bacterium]